MTSEALDVDLAVRIEFAHAALQHLADTSGIDLLHIKGIAFAPQWRSRASGGSDADILVRPSQIDRFLRSLEGTGWQRRSRFRTGSPFGHAQTYWHDHLGYADVHRFFPGLGKDEGTFDVLWEGREVVELASTPCPVPGQVAQALISVVNAARNGPPGLGRSAEVQDPALEAEMVELVPRLNAEVAWAAAHGRLHTVRDHREHDLWHAVTTDAGRVEEWRARVRAETTVVGKAVTVLRAPLVNTDHLANTRGRRPTAAEVVVEFLDRGRRAALEVWRGRRDDER